MINSVEIKNMMKIKNMREDSKQPVNKFKKLDTVEYY